MKRLAEFRSRHRYAYVLLAALTIVAGLASRAYPQLLPKMFGKYPGDALYAVLVERLIVLAFPVRVR